MGQIYGYRRMTIELNRRTNQHYNHKRIRRIMGKLGLRSIIRRPRRGCTVARDGYYEPNRLNRNFTASFRNEKWVTDVTYLQYGNGQKAYLSAVKDLYTGEIISHVVSKRNDNPLVMTTLKKAFLANRGAQPLTVTAAFNTRPENTPVSPRHITSYAVCPGLAAALITRQWRASGATTKWRPMIGGSSLVTKSSLPQLTSTFTSTTTNGTRQN